jgi:hypothetical protein
MMDGAMDRPIAYDRLAREDRFVRMRTRDVAGTPRWSRGLAAVPDLSSRESMRDRVHGILVGELQAMEGAGRTVYDFPDAPWEIHHGHGAPGVGRVASRRDVPRACSTISAATSASSPRRHCCGAVRARRTPPPAWPACNRGLEGLACDVFNQLIHIARKIGDPVLERSVDYVLADEITTCAWARAGSTS